MNIDVSAGAYQLAEISRRFPNETKILGQVFKNTTNSYKLVWFLAILSLIKRGNSLLFRFADVFAEMAVVAWHPVCLFRLSLGCQDDLQKVLLEIQQLSELPQNSSHEVIRSYLETSTEAQLKLDRLGRYVPARFLTPWFKEQLRGRRDSEKNAIIKSLARNHNKCNAALYYFVNDGGQEAIVLDSLWRDFLLENLGIIQSFAEHHFTLYLQTRNPNIPGVVSKLRAPRTRQLKIARKFWSFIRTRLEMTGCSDEFRDIYSERQLGEMFSIDHFLPWSFVAHDLIWNLTPVEPETNSSKSDHLPDLDLYLPRLAKLHFVSLGLAKEQPKLLEHYTDCFKVDPTELLALGERGFASKYREVILPAAQIAKNQGFQSGWKFGA